MKQYFTCTCILLSLLFTLPSCSTKNAGENDQTLKPQSLGCLLVLPTSTTVDSSAKMTFQEAEQLQRGAQFINTVLTAEIGGREIVRIVDESQLDAFFPEAVKGGKNGVINALGKSLDCEAVMLPVVSRFNQRKGGALSVDEPASAAFELKIIDTRDGKILWTASFNETQQTVLSNLFSFRKAENRGFKWITVEELTRQGLQEKIELCPYF